MAKKIIRVAPSLLAADFTNLDKEMKRVHTAKADWIHLDIMDGQFVPNISFGIPVVEAMDNYLIFKDVHLMISNPMEYALKFIDAGADLITFHIEAMKYKKDVRALIKLIHEYGRCAGIAINPKTPIEAVLPFMDEIDVVLVMSVEPGFGGQKFMPEVIQKIEALDQYIIDNDLECMIEVDGGINEITAKDAVDAGADILVAGSYLFKGDMKANVKILKQVNK